MTGFLVGNNFQRMADAKIELEIRKSTVPRIQSLLPKLPIVTDYIQGMIFDTSNRDFLNAHANYNVARDNFLSFWKRRLDLGFEKKEDLIRIWENALVNPVDYKDVSTALMIFHDGRAMSVDSFVDAIIEVLLLT